MTFKALLQSAKATPMVAKHLFLLSNGTKVVFCFFEGQTDESFYGGFIRNKLPPNYLLQTHQCGNKNAVYKMFDELAHLQKSPTRCLFFVDRDIDHFIPITRKVAPSIFVTDRYAIESYLDDVNVIERAVSELFRVGTGNQICTHVLTCYAQTNQLFQEYFLDVMAWVLFLRRHPTEKANLNNIKINELVSIDSDLSFSVLVPFTDAIPLLDKWCGTTTPADYFTATHENLKTELMSEAVTHTIRGKFLLWLIVEFLKKVLTAIRDFGPPKKISQDINLKNALDVLAPRVTSPATLDFFLSSNLP